MDWQKLKREFEFELTDNSELLGDTSLRTHRKAFSGLITNDGKKNPETPLSAVFTTRLMWTFSAAYRIYPTAVMKTMANEAFNEPFNLWEDKAAQEAFYFQWNMWAKRVAAKTQKQISFDLVNEPCTREDMNDQHSDRGPIPGELYREVAKKALETIRSHNPSHLVIAEGNDVGGKVVPEIFDLSIGQSCRGYFPHYITHYRVPWVFKKPDDAPKPVWPGKIDEQEFNRKSIEDYYKPWIDAVKAGVGVHYGECGCWNETPHDIFLA